MDQNLRLYGRYAEVPQEAQKKITGGRLNGKTDINPMWRIKSLTEEFGECGFGWYYTVKNRWLEPGANGEVAGFVEIELFVKRGEAWSAPICGMGGSMFVAKEKTGLYTSDEVYKMATTDAISVACKQLGFGASVYWSGDNTKYTNVDSAAQDEVEAPKMPTNEQELLAHDLGIKYAGVVAYYKLKSEAEITYDILQAAIEAKYKALEKAKKAEEPQQ